jgi:hypothetical protein
MEWFTAVGSRLHRAARPNTRSVLPERSNCAASWFVYSGVMSLRKAHSKPSLAGFNEEWNVGSSHRVNFDVPRSKFGPDPHPYSLSRSERATHAST